MRIAVTGASGFVGGRTARALAALGHQVWSYGRRDVSALSAPLPRYHAWDVAAGPTNLHHVEAVVHCAAHVAQWGPRDTFQAVNERGMTHLLESLAPGTAVVLVSTASVYDGDASDHDRGMPPYAWSKRRGERLLLASGVPAVILRPHVIYGPGDTTLWPRVRSRIRAGRLLVPGTGRAPMSVTHVDNLVHAIERALHAGVADKAPPDASVFDIADAVVPTVHELLRTMTDRYGVPTRLVYLPAPVATMAAGVCELAWTAVRGRGEPPLTRYVVRQLAQPSVLDIEPARRLLGYAPRWSFRDGPL